MAKRETKDEDVMNVRLILAEINEDNHEKISRKLYRRINGVVSCEYIGENNEVLVHYDKTVLDQYKLLSAIQELGYSPELKECQLAETQLRIEGMHCNSCVSNICDAVMDLPGAIDIQLTFADKLATIIFDPSLLQFDQIVEEIEKLSFQVAVFSPPTLKGTSGDQAGQSDIMKNFYSIREFS